VRHEPPFSSVAQAGKLQIHFMDVGQVDGAILIAKPSREVSATQVLL
jgi:hypothetical protein